MVSASESGESAVIRRAVVVPRFCETSWLPKRLLSSSSLIETLLVYSNACGDAQGRPADELSKTAGR
eukprot:scaffold1088_cov247-Pinguiococcus_pyrenoidosus.AAC.9